MRHLLLVMMALFISTPALPNDVSQPEVVKGELIDGKVVWQIAPPTAINKEGIWISFDEECYGDNGLVSGYHITSGDWWVTCKPSHVEFSHLNFQFEWSFESNISPGIAITDFQINDETLIRNGFTMHDRSTRPKRCLERRYDSDITSENCYFHEIVGNMIESGSKYGTSVNIAVSWLENSSGKTSLHEVYADGSPIEPGRKSTEKLYTKTVKLDLTQAKELIDKQYAISERKVNKRNHDMKMEKLKEDIINTYLPILVGSLFTWWLYRNFRHKFINLVQRGYAGLKATIKRIITFWFDAKHRRNEKRISRIVEVEAIKTRVRKEVNAAPLSTEEMLKEQIAQALSRGNTQMATELLEIFKFQQTKKADSDK